MSRTASHCYSSVARLLLCFCSAVILFDSVPCTAGVLLSFCRYCVYSDSTLLHVLLLPCCLKRMFVALSPGLPVLRVRDSKSPTYGYNILRLRTLLYIFIEIEVVSYPFWSSEEIRHRLSHSMRNWITLNLQPLTKSSTNRKSVRLTICWFCLFEAGSVMLSLHVFYPVAAKWNLHATCLFCNSGPATKRIENWCQQSRNVSRLGMFPQECFRKVDLIAFKIACIKN